MLRRLLVAAVLAFTCGCRDDDAPIDAAVDATELDGAVDASTDGMPRDAQNDVLLDAATDATSDSRSDSGLDAPTIEYGLQTSPDPQPDYGGTVFRVSDDPSLARANSDAEPGDVIELVAGTYTDWRFSISASGSDARRLIVRAESPGVTFTGDSQMRITGTNLWVEGFRFVSTEEQALVVVGSFNRITRNYFEGCGTTGRETIRLVDRSTEVELDNNEITDSHRQSIIAFSPNLDDPTQLGPQRHDIHHNFIHDIPRRIDNGGEAMTSIGGRYDPAERYENRFEYNLIERFSNDAEVLSVKNGGWLVRYNRFVDCEGTLTLRISNNCTIEANVFVRSEGIRIAGANHQVLNNHFDGSETGLILHHGYLLADGSPSYLTARDNLIAHNTFRVMGDQVAAAISRPAPYVYDASASSNVIVNNVFWRVDGGAWLADSVTNTFLEDNTWRRNIFWSGGGAYPSADLPSGEGIVSEDPRLSSTGGWLVPDADSVVVDAGESGHTPIDARARTRDESPDIGALERRD